MPGKMLLYTDGEYNEGVYYFTTRWVYGPSEEGIPPITHDHSYNEYLDFSAATQSILKICAEKWNCLLVMKNIPSPRAV